MNHTKHTPTPWLTEGSWYSKNGRHEIRSAACRSVGFAPLAYIKGDKRVTGGDGAANAAFIVLACNAHDQLVHALREVLSMLEAEGLYDNPECEAGRAALAAVEAQP